MTLLNSKIFVAWESANSYIKALSNIKNSILTRYLNTITFIDEADAYDRTSGTLHTGVYRVQLSSIVNAEDNVFVRVGVPLGEGGEESSAADSVERYKSREYKIESAIAIFSQIKQHESFPNFDSSQFVYATTGIPVKHAKSKKAFEYIKQNICQKFTIETSEGVTTFTVKEVEVVRQGEACHYSRLLQKDGSADKEYVLSIAKKNLLFIDIGNGTTEFIAVRHLMPAETASLTGMLEPWTQVLNSIDDDDFNAAGPKVLGIEKDLQEGHILTFNNVTVDVKTAKEQALRKYALKLVKNLSKDGLKDTEYNEIIIAGGGSYALKKYIDAAVREVYSNQGLIDRFKYIEGDRQAANVDGYLKYGMNVFKQKYS